MQGGWAVREDWAAANLASFSNGFEKLKNVGEHITEQSKKAQSILAPMIEDAFELREKTEAQRELERWSAEQEQGRAPKPQVAAAKPRRFSGVVAASPGERSPGSAATPAAPATEHAALPPTSAHSTPGVSLLPATVSAEAKPKALQETAAKAPSALQTPAGSEAPPAAEDEGRTRARADAAQPEEAPMQDKVILQQRVQLEQLRRDKAAAEAEQERLAVEKMAALALTQISPEQHLCMAVVVQVQAEILVEHHQVVEVIAIHQQPIEVVVDHNQLQIVDWEVLVQQVL